MVDIALIVQPLSFNYSWDACTAFVSKAVRVYNYTASTNVIMSIFIPELQLFEILTFFLVDPVYDIHKSVVTNKEFPYFRTVYFDCHLMLHILCAW
jgi:hypothetical protein